MDEPTFEALLGLVGQPHYWLTEFRHRRYDWSAVAEALAAGEHGDGVVFTRDVLSAGHAYTVQWLKRLKFALIEKIKAK
jgi:hypothetical protein